MARRNRARLKKRIRHDQAAVRVGKGSSLIVALLLHLIRHIQFPSETPGGDPRSFHSFNAEEQADKIKKRLADYCRRV
jgi:hypothetical protein